MIFKKPTNALEGHGKLILPAGEIARENGIICPKCKKTLFSEELEKELRACPYCRYHFKLNARQRIHMIADTDTFIEADKGLLVDNILEFPGYDEKLKAARLQSAEADSVICGECKIGKNRTALFVMEPQFMMGSMGSVTGKKITRIFEYALAENIPVTGFTVSGGARMQEGIISLMQMAKTSGAVKKHSDGGNLFLCVLTDPTTGGVTASFAMEADIILAEPYALIGFAGPRVIEQTIRKKLPTGFQSAEFQLEHGFIDDIVDRKRQKKHISQLLKMHTSGVHPGKEQAL